MTRGKDPSPLVLAVFGVVFVCYIAGSLLASNDWNPTLFIKFPESLPAEMAYARGHLGEVIPAPGFGHDGKFFFMQAMDPLFLHPEDHAVFLDRPTYRAQRMMYPTIAGGFGTFSPIATAWAMLIVNVVAVGIGTWLTARLAIDMGLRPLFGLAFALNPGILVSATIDTAEVVAMMFFVGSALLLFRKHYLGAAVLITCSALSRETMLLGALGAAMYYWRNEKRIPFVFSLPFVAVAAWWVYLRAVIGDLGSELQDTRAIGLPFNGFVEAISSWLTHGLALDLVMGVVLMGASLVILWKTLRRPSALGYMTAGFALIAILMVEGVWLRYFDASRALAPVITTYILLAPSYRSSHRSSSDEPVLAET